MKNHRVCAEMRWVAFFFTCSWCSNDIKNDTHVKNEDHTLFPHPSSISPPLCTALAYFPEHFAQIIEKLGSVGITGYAGGTPAWSSACLPTGCVEFAMAASLLPPWPSAPGESVLSVRPSHDDAVLISDLTLGSGVGLSHLGSCHRISSGLLLTSCTPACTAHTHIEACPLTSAHQSEHTNGTQEEADEASPSFAALGNAGPEGEADNQQKKSREDMCCKYEGRW